ncbi:MAG: hypothetical protein J5J00_14970 [Deltaproteobacteria bacterium]|nr:hypothetical protein [Deltaproteobacteria bacterium]
MMIHQKRKNAVVAVVVIMLLLTVCLLIGMPSSTPQYIQSANLSKWNSQGPFNGKAGGWGPNAKGDWVAPANFQGSYTWVVYSAPWCHTAAMQANTLKQLETSTPGVNFITVLTTGSSIDESASLENAVSWASNHSLPKTNVLASEQRLPLVSPRHLLYAASGRAVFAHEGWMAPDEIMRTIQAIGAL